MESDAPSYFSLAREILWPRDAAERKHRKNQYKNAFFFLAATSLLVKYAKPAADMIYSQELMEESMKMGIR